MKCNYFFLLLIGLIMSGCFGDHEDSAEHAEKITMAEAASDLSVPAELWAKISPGPLKANTAAFMPIKLILKEKTKGVLTSPVIEFEFPKGGGEVDIGKYINTQTRGTFYVKFDFDGFKSPETLKAFFLSQTRKQKLDQEVIGLGCKTFADLTENLIKLNGKDGMAMNTTDGRHTIALGGTFFFSYEEKKQTLVTQVTIKDSSRPTFFCPREKEGSND